MISSHRIGPAPFISVNECGAGELLILMHGIGGNKPPKHANRQNYEFR